MSFLDLLQTVGDRLGILEAPAKTSAGGASKVITRTVTIGELKSEIRSEDVRALADLPAELSLPFEKIFEAAGVAPPAHAWSVARLKEVLHSERFQAQERAAAQQALLSLLGAEQTSPEDLVKEAVAQDQALDAFENFVGRKVADHLATAEHGIAELDSKIQALQSQRAGSAERIRQEQEKLREWRLRKRAYERELAWAVRYLTDRPVITTEEEGPPA